MLKSIARFLNGLSKRSLLALSLAAVVLIGVVDQITGSEWQLSIFYLGPIALVAWFGSKRAGIALAFLAAAAWLLADITTDHEYSSMLIPVWNSCVKLGFFVIITVLLSIIKRDLEMEQAFASTDSLTGLANSRTFCEQLERERERTKRYGRPFTIAYIDLDNFKYVNDTQGHDVGDLVLRCVAETITRATRRTDTIARLGGDEFAGLFPETDSETSLSLMRQIQSCLLDTMNQNAWPVTFSIGAVTFQKPMDSVREMINEADHLMYSVKKARKNDIAHRTWNGET